VPSFVPDDYLQADTAETPRADPPKGGEAKGTTKAPRSASPRDRIVKGTRRSKAQAKLTMIGHRHPTEKTPAWMDTRTPDDSYVSKKMEGGAQQSASPALEDNPRVLKYRWNAQENRYQVTKYDTKRVSLGENGTPQIGVMVTLNGQKEPLHKAIEVLRGHAKATLKAFKTLQKTPLGDGSAKTALGGVQTHITLKKALQSLDIAEANAKAGHGKKAQEHFAQATRLYVEGQAQATNTAKDIRSHTTTTIEALKAVRTLGKIAEIGLVVVGGGAVAKLAGSALKRAGVSVLGQAFGSVAAGAVTKTALQTAVEVGDHKLDHPDKPLDWKAIASHAGTNLFWNTVSGSLTRGIEQGLTKTFSVKTVEELSKGAKISAHAIGEAAVLLTRLTKMSL
ncbi:MAG: hypothetical protein KAI47_27660, partial [Deltaproteobacteria bacterium]|nr:hypothetical protein [Deltaproteobacteria bacterium]